MTPEELNGLTLAYLGDAVLEIMVREKVIESGVTDVGRLNNMARTFVKASEQSIALNNILDDLDEEELSFFKRGRNVLFTRYTPPRFILNIFSKSALSSSTNESSIYIPAK